MRRGVGRDGGAVMSPLAQMIVNQDLALGVGQKVSTPELQTSDCHCFETSEVMDLIGDLVGNYNWRGRDDPHIFLPSPYTWIENKTKNGRNGALLYRNPYGPVPLKGGMGKMPDPIVARLFAFNADDTAVLFCQNIMFIGMSDTGAFTVGQHGEHDGTRFDDMELRVRGRLLAATLAVINTPRIIGRRQHMPHAGLQKRIAAAKRMVGRFPLRSWTEIKLEVTAPSIDGTEHEARLSGGKALHFCRAHLRIRLGKLERVSAHWRGDPSLGIKRSRYVMVPPRKPQPMGETVQ